MRFFLLLLPLLEGLFSGTEAGHSHIKKVLCNDKDMDGYGPRLEIRSDKDFAEFCPDGKLVIKEDAELDGTKIVYQLAMISALPVMKVKETPGTLLLGEEELTEAGTVNVLPSLAIPEIDFCGQASIVINVVDAEEMAMDFFDIQVEIPCLEAEDQDLGLKVTEDLTKIARAKISPGQQNLFEAAGLSEIAVVSKGSSAFQARTSMSKPIVSAYIYNSKKYLFPMWDQFKDSKEVCFNNFKVISKKIVFLFLFFPAQTRVCHKCQQRISGKFVHLSG